MQQTTSILNIRPAVRGGSKVIIGIAGVSGSGKTYTALKIARGMVSKPSEIGFLDTENRRGSLYADILDGQFLIGDLFAPFSPKRYIEAIKEFQAAGVKVLVIDSISHEFEGDGGVEDIAEQPKLNGAKMADWKMAKSQHKKFMNALLQCDMHVICCIRAREKMDFKNPKEPVSLGIQPVCEKNFMFEMTASFLIEDEGKIQHPKKIPSFFKDIFGSGKGYIGESAGAAIIKWTNEGEKESESLSKFKSEMQMTCENGLEELKKAWAKGFEALSKEDRIKANTVWKSYEASAKSYDEQSEIGKPNDLLFDLTELYELKKEAVGLERKTEVERIINDKIEASYQKAIDFLKSL